MAVLACPLEDGRNILVEGDGGLGGKRDRATAEESCDETGLDHRYLPKPGRFDRLEYSTSELLPNGIRVRRQPVIGSKGPPAAAVSQPWVLLNENCVVIG
jgi:hypothetical protein